MWGWGPLKEEKNSSGYVNPGKPSRDGGIDLEDGKDFNRSSKGLGEHHFFRGNVMGQREQEGTRA